MECPSCKVEMESLVAGIFQCPQCRKIIKEKDKDTDISAGKSVQEGVFQDGEYFHKNVSINKNYEVCEKGITINKTESRLFAALICHTPYLKDVRYIRLSWWKSLQHEGMFKIYDKDVLKNIIISLEKIEESFDEFWTWGGKYEKQEPKTEKDLEKEKALEIIKYRILENKTCPKCSKKMNKKKSYYNCQHCGEIVILEGYNQPIFDIKPTDLDLRFHSNFPINFYLPVSGITVKNLMGEWKALVVIYSKDNPNRKWLRFYWWEREFKIKQNKQGEMGEGTQMSWEAKRGTKYPNFYDKKLIRPLISALNKISVELKWENKQ